MSVYKFVELVGTSSTSWEDAALSVVAEAGQSLDELRIAEVVKKDLVVTKGRTLFRIRVNLSFMYLREEEAPAAKPAQEKAAPPGKKAVIRKAEPRKAKKKAGKKDPLKK